MPAPVLDRRSLNRALLARQHLLERAAMPVPAMVEHLVAMQAQNPLDPYIALWSRLDGFTSDDLANRVEERQAVRIGLLRTTLHLTTADDAVALWPVTRPVLERAWASSPFRKQLDDRAVPAIAAAARDLLEERPRTMAELGAALAQRWPAFAPGPLSYVARFLLPIVQIPPRGVWGRTGRPIWTTIEAWLGRPLDGDPRPDGAILRYLAAFGPASAADVRTWSWLTGARQALDRLRPQLLVVRDESGRELFDLPDAPRPDRDTPAPPRFLPEYDNLLLSHGERSRVVADVAVGRVTGWVGTYLVDGFLRGQWIVRTVQRESIFILEPFGELEESDWSALTDEAGRLHAFMAPDVASRRIEVGIAREALTPPP